MSKRKHSKHQKIDERLKLKGTEDQPLVVSLSDYLPSGFSLVSLELVRGSDENATFEINEETGEVIVTPSPDYNGPIFFRYVIENDCGETFVGRGKVKFKDVPDTDPGTDDVLYGTDEDNELNGFGGNDTLFGLAGNDILNGGTGEDILDGGDGYDILNGGEGADILIGGDGEDHFIINQGDGSEIEDTFDGGELYDTLCINGDHAATPFVVDLGDIKATSIEHIELSADNAESLSLSADDVAQFNDDGGIFRISGSSNDTLVAQSDWSFNYVALGYDQVYFHYSAEDTNGDNQTVFVAMEIGTLDGFEAPQYTTYFETIPNVYQMNPHDGSGDTSAFNDINSTENLQVNTGEGRAYIATGSGNDVINIGGRGYVYTGDGDDVVIGGTDRDYIRGSEGSDFIDAGDGNDTVTYYRSPEGININLETGIHSGGYAAGDTLIDVEIINGSQFDDVLIGDSGNNSLYGEYGDDTLIGGGGDDYFLTGPGDDIVDGGAGNDVLGFNSSYGDFDGTFDGGADFDTLRLSSYNRDVPEWDVDLSLINATNFENILLESSSFSQTTLSLTIQDVLNVTDSDNELRIDGTALDSVDSTGQGWVQGGDQDVDGETYHTYTAGGATLLVDADIVQDIT